MKQVSGYMLSRMAGKFAWFWMVAGMIAFSSCEEIMNVDFAGNNSQNLVVEGEITTDTAQQRVVLSYSDDYFAIGQKKMATGASVYISEGENIIPLEEQEEGVYITATDVYGQVGRKYTLHIKLADGKEYSASDSIRACADIDSIRQSENYNTFLSGYGYDVIFYGHEPQPAGDHYLYLLQINGRLYTDTITEVTFASDEFVNGNFVKDYPVYRIREKDLIDVTSIITLEMHSISKAYYDFLSALMVETVWRGSPWDGPPANIPGNISNGATGFFRASAIKRKDRIFVQSPRVN